MPTQDYSSTVLVKQSPSAAFNAIKNFRAWWSEQIEGETDKLNEVFYYNYKDVHLCKIKLVEVIPNEKLVYHIVDNNFSFIQDKTEWVDTKLIFAITTVGEDTKIQFSHEGLNSTHECYNICADSWGGYVKKSLYNLITSGKGQPNPKDSEDFDSEVVKKWKLK